MRIKTEKFAMPRSVYMEFLFRTIMLRSIVGSVLLIIVAFVIAPYSWIASILFTFMAVGEIIKDYLIIIKMTKPEKNDLIYQRRYITLEDQYITVFMEDDTKHKINLKNVSKLEEMQHFFHLYISRMQLLCIDTRAFKSHEDLRSFKSFISQVVRYNNSRHAEIGRSG